MLEWYFLRPVTCDRIRARWLGPAIEQYVTWLTERRAAPLAALSSMAGGGRYLGPRVGDLARHVGVVFEEWSAQNWRTSRMVAAGFSNGTR